LLVSNVRHVIKPSQKIYKIVKFVANLFVTLVKGEKLINTKLVINASLKNYLKEILERKNLF